MLDITRHFLRANQHALDFRVAGRSEVRSRVRMDWQSRLRKQLERGFLQTAFGYSEADLHRACSCIDCGAGAPAREDLVSANSSFVKHDRVPSWQTTPS